MMVLAQQDLLLLRQELIPVYSLVTSKSLQNIVRDLDSLLQVVYLHRRQGTRNTPTLINRGYGKSQFLDGRAESLEQQVLQPILGANELGEALDLGFRQGLAVPRFVLDRFDVH